MLNKDQLLTIAVIVSVIGISFLYLFSAQQSTVRLNVSEIDEGMIGSRVMTQGTISRLNWFDYIVLLDLKEEDHHGTLTVAIEKQIIEDVVEDEKELKAGAKVEVEGLLEDYQGDLSLNVDELGGISILEKAHSRFTEFSSLLENPEWYEGMEVKVRGDVVEKRNTPQETTLILSSHQDSNYRYELTCIIDGWEEEKEIHGKPVVVEGEWIYDNTSGRWILEASNPDIRYVE